MTPSPFIRGLFKLLSARTSSLKFKLIGCEVTLWSHGWKFVGICRRQFICTVTNVYS